MGSHLSVQVPWDKEHELSLHSIPLPNNIRLLKKFLRMEESC